VLSNTRSYFGEGEAGKKSGDLVKELPEVSYTACRDPEEEMQQIVLQ
jgi:hypothetical protein